jgi:hypothetical protein
MNSVRYYHDGYTESGYIAAVPRLHGALRFAYRPALIEERSQLLDAAARLKAPLYDRHLAVFVADKLISWDLEDAVGTEVPIAAESLLRTQPELFAKLHRIVLGARASDVDPAWPSETKHRLFDDETEAALIGRAIGEVRAERDEKN